MNELPVPIIHHVLSFLPGDEQQSVTKLVTKLNLVSKWWQHACSSYPVIDFSYYQDDQTTPPQHEKIQRFIQFVDNTMNRYRDSNKNTVEKLKLHFDFEILPDCRYYIIDELPILLDKWINIALDKQIHHLDLRVRCVDLDAGPYSDQSDSPNRFDHNWRYHIPTRVLSSDIVKSLSLGWQISLPQSWEDHPHHLSSLHSLELHQVQDFDHDEDSFQRLIRACSSIQKLTIDTQLDEIKLLGLDHLKMVTIRRRYISTYIRINKFKLKIELPSLETLSLTDLGHGRHRFCYYTASIDLDCSNLRYLKLTRDRSLDEDQFHQLLSQLPLLKSLQVEDCSLINNINIANPLLKKIELKFGNLWKILNVQISSPKVAYFRCESTSGKRLPSIYWTSNYPRYVEAVFDDTVNPLHLYCFWFRKLRESMLRLKSDNNHISMSFNYIWKKESLEEKELVPTSLPACKIDNLNLSITAHNSSSYAVILSRLFSTFHPETFQLYDNDNGQGGRNFLQFVCENLSNRGKVSSCSNCFGHFKCWKHQLVDVKIQGTKGPHEEDWATMLKQLSNLTVNHHICFELEWAT